MPFTFAHPAVVIPLKNKFDKYFNLTALVLGSMSPDFEYFLNLKIKSEIGHSLIGFITYNLPLVFMFAIIFNMIIKPTLSLHLPICINRYIKIDDDNSGHALKHNLINNIMIFIISALIGMLSHVLWDSFTHETGLFVKIFPTLTTSIIGIPFYKLLQHGGTLLGLTYIFKVLYYKRSNIEVKYNQTVANKRKIYYWASVIILSIIFLVCRQVTTWQRLDSWIIGTFIVTAISGFFVSITLVSIVFYRRKPFI